MCAAIRMSGLPVWLQLRLFTAFHCVVDFHCESLLLSCQNKTGGDPVDLPWLCGACMMCIREHFRPVEQTAVSMQIRKGQRGKDRKSWREGEGVCVCVCVLGGGGC